jgi:xanthine dehydrogenase accessory factor
LRELEKIISEIRRLRTQGMRCVLATVVDVAGSAYRLPGARMLVTEAEWLAGSISGGCLESDVVTRAREVIASNQATVVTYDTTGDDDIVFGVGLGCRGVIRVLLEPVAMVPGSADFVSFAERCLQRQQAGIVATVVDAGTGAVRTGSRLLSVAGGTVASDIENTEIKNAIEKHLLEIQGTTESGLKVLNLREASVEVFFEAIQQPTPLIVFGAGHDAMPLVRLGKELGWHVTVVDHRPAYTTAKRFPETDAVVISGRDQIPEQIKFTADTLAVIMTHNYLRDLSLVKALLQSPARYVGLLGPKKRTNELLTEAKQQGFEATTEQLQRFYAPVGLDIGSENPEEVALSIVAEMRAVIANRAPGHLRNRSGAIHSDRVVDAQAESFSKSGRAGDANSRIPSCPTTA